MLGTQMLAVQRGVTRPMTVTQASRRHQLILIFTGMTVALFSADAFAQAAPGQQPPFWMQLFPIVVVFAIMYFLMIRPQAKKQKAHQEFLSKMKRGDQVVTASGILGRVEGLTDTFVTLEIADGVRVKILKTQIAASATTATASAAEAKA